MVEPLLLIETKYLTKKKKKVELNGLRPSVQIANAIGCLLAFSNKTSGYYCQDSSGKLLTIASVFTGWPSSL